MLQSAAVRFLTWTFHNVFYVRVGKCYVRLWLSQCSQTVEEACGETDWKTLAGAGATPTAAAGTADTPPARKPNLKLNQWPPWALFCLKLDNSCCSCSLDLWQQLQRCCRQTRARVPLFFKRILLPFYRNSSPQTIHFSGKRMVISKRSR